MKQENEEILDGPAREGEARAAQCFGTAKDGVKELLKISL
jgi:hypothetical protein